MRSSDATAGAVNRAVATDPVDVRRRRRAALLATIPVTAAGLLVVLLGQATGGLVLSVADPAGDALYAVLVYAVLTVVAPRARRSAVAAAAFGVCAALELLQLTGMPASLAERAWVWRLVLGTTFSPLDLVAYAVGVAVAWAAERWRTGR